MNISDTVLEFEDALGVAVQVVVHGFVAQPEIIETVQGVLVSDHRIVGAEQDFSLPVPVRMNAISSSGSRFVV